MDANLSNWSAVGGFVGAGHLDSGFALTSDPPAASISSSSSSDEPISKETLRKLVLTPATWGGMVRPSLRSSANLLNSAYL